MAGEAPEACHDAKMRELLQDFFTSYDEVFDSFDVMGLQENFLRGIYAYGFEKPSAIQQPSAIHRPSAIQLRDIDPFCKGLDVIQQAQSGTGKATPNPRHQPISTTRTKLSKSHLKQPKQDSFRRKKKSN